MEGLEDKAQNQARTKRQPLRDITQAVNNWFSQTKEGFQKIFSKPKDAQEKLKWIVLDLERAIEENNPRLMMKSAEKINAIFSKDWSIEQILNTNLIEILVKFLRNQNPESANQIREFLRILVNITSASKSHAIQELVDLDIISIASRFVQHKDFKINENALVLLANIAGEGLVYLNQIIKEESDNISQAILAKQKDNVPVSFEIDLSWFLKVLFWGTPRTDFERLSPFMPIVQELFLKTDEKEIIMSTLHCLAFFCEEIGETERIQKYLSVECLKRVLSFLDYSKYDRQIHDSAMKIIGCLTGQQHQILLEFGLIEKIEGLLERSEEDVLKKSAWVLSNILTDKRCVDAVIEYKERKIILNLLKMIQTEKFCVAKECFYCLINIYQYAESFTQLEELVDGFPLIETLIAFLRRRRDDEEIINTCLDALEAILWKEKEYKGRKNKVKRELTSCGGIILIKTLQNHPRILVSERAAMIVKVYLNNDL